MPQKLYAIRYNGADCLIHIRYDDEKMTVRILSDELAKDIHVNSFEMRHDGELITPAIGSNDISLPALRELYNSLLKEHCATPAETMRRSAA